MNYNELWHLLAQRYDEGEAKAIARMTYEVRFGLTFSDLCLGKDTQLSADDQTELEEIAQRLSKGEPIQYVLGQAEFCGRTFLVNEAVLIPRPETEELCRWIAESEKRKVISDKCSILDIGTGSGCIAITLAAEMLQAQVTAWDISAEALEVARENAKRTNVHVSFEQVDALHLTSDILHQTSGVFDLIVSNPPYICNKERATMETNVLEHEPHTALFVPDDDPLLFYRAIAQYGQTALKEGGWLYFEINPLYADALADMLKMMSYYDINTKQDQFGKQRMMRARKK
jgi:release factor glutamine methyltransferase